MTINSSDILKYVATHCGDIYKETHLDQNFFVQIQMSTREVVDPAMLVFRRLQPNGVYIPPEWLSHIDY